jgi:hypothetical protein
MAKLVSLVKSAPHVSNAEFAAYWKNDFLPELLQLEIPRRSLQKVVHNHALGSDLRTDEGLPGNNWAGAGFYYFESQADIESLLASPEFKRLYEKHKAVIAEATHLIVDEIWMYNRDTSHLPIKAFAFFKLKPEFTRERGLKYYRTTHADVGESINHNRTVRYIQNHVVEGYVNPDAQYNYDGGPEIWFKSMEVAMDLFSDTAAMEYLGEDEEKFVRRAESLHFLTDEAVVFERQHQAA